MLKGRSGTGKSTILDAIFDALYGEAEGVIPWGESSACVELHLTNPRELVIKRTRGPATLTVTDADGNITKDDAAQAIINETLGMSSHEFLACSYIQQNMQGSLLTLSPGEQLKFVQKLSMGLSDPEKIKKAIDDIIKTEKQKINHLNADLAALKDREVQNAHKINLTSNELLGIVMIEISDKAKSAQDELQVVSKEVSALSKQYSDLDIVLSSDIYEFLDSIPRMEEKLAQKQKESKDKISENQAKMAEIHKEAASLDVKTSQSKLDFLEIKARSIENLQKLRNLSKSVVLDYPKAKDFPKASDFITAELALLQQEFEELNEKRSAIEPKLRELEGKKKPQHCPDCSTPLAISGGLIIKAESVPDDLEASISNLKLQKKTMDDRQAAIRSAESRLFSIQATAESLKKDAVIKDDQFPDIKTLEVVAEVKAQTKEIMLKHQELLKKISILDSENGWILDDVQKYVKEVSAAHERRDRNSSIKPRQEVMADKNLIWTKIQEKNKESEVLTELAKQHSEYLRAKNKIDILKRDMDVRKEEQIEIISEINAVSNKLATATDRVGAAGKLKEINDFASMAAVEVILDQINQNAVEYLEKMFPNDGTQISLKNVSTTKGGDERAKISVEMFHKGQLHKKIPRISGGERSRACLAFQLAVADLYKSPILLIDEGFTGLDDIDQDECMAILRDLTPNKMVIVIEHGASESIFDEVINV
jgi:DNA repair exonuclease SbcCD ATPase subunit